MIPWAIAVAALLAIVFLVILLSCYILRRKSGYIKRLSQTTSRDLRGLFILIRMRLRCSLAFWRNKGIQTLFLETVQKHPHKEAIYDITLGKSYTFTELDELSCRYGSMLQIGVISAWINTNLRAESLAHSLTSSKASVVLSSASLQKALVELYDSDASEPTRPLIFSGGNSDKPYIKPIDKLLVEQPSTQPTAKRQMTFQGLGQTIIHGATCVIRGKFSASNFWKDCTVHRCTVSQYIGEMLRYLLLTEKSAYESKHNVRLLIGNGLRPAIWHQFQQRFRIERIAEFYGSTEGTSNLVNIDGKEGSCGFMTIIKAFAPIYPIRLFKVNEETGELIRDTNGYCIPIRPGDVLFWDRLGYFYFRDRVGDTFRWKGENVSTTQVEAVLHGLKEVHECTVYGVEVPGCEGRAGMAAITPSNAAISVEDLLMLLHQKFTAALPGYAVPCFLRLTSDIEKTGTFKMKKAALQALGTAPSPTTTVYYLDNTRKGYSILTESVLCDLEQGRKKL
ncbi:unnamed protein product [Heligmosomoides polygyrus]|uniref:long-chain-fatty-acid--CoA ligase n=1 Tax=Heligmosomoides polygyrus TaxID=6339 RepID=A0A3P8A3Z6_HELPZ|nr:unnamed protein product [Heligmosomoides polygyrus]